MPKGENSSALEQQSSSSLFEQFETYLQGTIKKTSASATEAVSNLMEIAKELLEIADIQDPEKQKLIFHGMLLLFPGSEKNDGFADVVNGERGKEYTRDLLAFIRDQKDFLIGLKSHTYSRKSLCYHFNAEDDEKAEQGMVNFMNSTFDLFVMHKAQIPIENSNIHDILATSNLLRNEKVFKRQMDNLEKSLVNYAKDKNIVLKEITLNSGKKILTLPDDASPYAKKKVLSGFLYQWAKDNNFNQTQYAKINRFLKTDQFLSLLNSKTIFKDAGAGAGHGPWAHVLQLFILTEENKSKPFLTQSFDNFYASLGNPACKGTKSFLNWKSSLAPPPLTRWDIMFDRENAGNKKDFGTPEVITTRLYRDGELLQKGKTSRWPILSTTFYRQKKKPKNDKVVTEDVTLRKYQSHS